MRRRIAVVLAAAIVTPAVALAALGDEAGSRQSPPDLAAIQERIRREWDMLAREGIFLMGSGRPARPCVELRLANPTEPNIRYLKQRYGQVCVRRKPEGYGKACSGMEPRSLPTGPVRVPDVRGLGIEPATSRLVAAGLTFSLGCLGDRERSTRTPHRYSPEQGVRIARQCPRPGEAVPRGTDVALVGKAILPGGFAFRISALTPYDTGTRHPCRDGRNAIPRGGWG